jgi:hypothetical protein
MGQLPAFLPSRDGFAFANSWPAEPGISLRTPVGTLGIGNAERGLCGGMVFAALDYWLARLAPPAQRPAGGSPLYRFIVRRLIDSWHLPAGVAKYYTWMSLGDVSRRSIERQWPRVMASIDSGRPAALGLVTVASAWPGQLGRNHQVLAYAYARTGTSVTIDVYDPNSGPHDDVRIEFDTAAPDRRLAFRHNIAIDLPVRGFFLTGYKPVKPPPA